mgnify:CR=1 FL=1
MKTALITGITGQDGSFLAEFLLEKGYEVHGTIRRSSVDYRERIAHLEGRPHFHLHYADLGDSMSLIQVVGKVRPDEIYNLAAQSHVQGRLGIAGRSVRRVSLPRRHRERNPQICFGTAGQGDYLHHQLQSEQRPQRQLQHQSPAIRA